MEVVKRNGEKEQFDFDKIMKVLQYAITNKDMYDEFVNDLHMNVRKDMKTTDIQNILVKLAAEKTSKENVEWQFVASKLLAYSLYKEASLNRGHKKKFGYHGYAKMVKDLVANGLYGSYMTKNYTHSQLEELGKYIKPERDYLLTFGGIEILSQKYLVKGFNKEIYELPQERFMAIAMTEAMNESKDNRVEWAKKYYDIISKLDIMTATPTLLNSGKPLTQLSSCFILTAGDNLWSIKDVDASAAQLSKYSGGIGIYVGDIRSRGSKIQQRKGLSNGIIPWLKGYEVTAKSVDQLGSRSGAIAVYVDSWHPDIFEVLNMTKPNGDARLRVLDLFPAMCVPDYFMEQVENRGKWWLIDPHEVFLVKGIRLSDLHGQEWKDMYISLVEDESFEKIEVNAIDIMRKFLESASETGKPFIFFRDTANKMNPNKHVGVIKASNLCTEIMQNTSVTTHEEDYIDRHGKLHSVKNVGDTVVCNLSSLNMLNTLNMTDDELEDVIYCQMRMLDNTIDNNFYPIKEAEITNKKYRAVGAGLMNYHAYMAYKNIRWESQEHIDEADSFTEKWAYFVIKASNRLARERGSYSVIEGSDWQTGEYFVLHGYVKRDTEGNIVKIEGKEKWYDLCLSIMDYGIRNGWCMAVAPTASISVVAGTTAGTDPVFSKFFMEEKDTGMTPQTAPGLNAKNFFLYKEAHTIDQTWSIEAQGARQKHIDQGNSFNLYVTQEVTPKMMLDYYLRAWKCKIKSVYYMRSKTLSVEECASCQ